MNSTDKKTHQSVYYSAMKSSLNCDHWQIRRSDFLFLSILKDEKKKKKKRHKKKKQGELPSWLFVRGISLLKDHRLFIGFAPAMGGR